MIVPPNVLKNIYNIYLYICGLQQSRTPLPNGLRVIVGVIVGVIVPAAADSPTLRA